jgi:hypothetical protein
MNTLGPMKSVQISRVIILEEYSLRGVLLSWTSYKNNSFLFVCDLENIFQAMNIKSISFFYCLQHGNSYVRSQKSISSGRKGN